MALRAAFHLKVTLPIVTVLATLLAFAGAGQASAAVGYAGVVAFQANTNTLWLRVLNQSGSGSTANTGLGMAAGTSPAIIFDDSSEHFKVAFQENHGHLCVYTVGASNFCTGLGMAAGTSPSIVDNPSNGVEVAFQDNQGRLCLYHDVGNTFSCMNLGMRADTSPSLGNAYSNGYFNGFEVAFQSNLGLLCVYHTATGNFCSGLGMAADSSPSLGDTADDGYIAFQSNQGRLCIYRYAPNTYRCTSLGVASGTSPYAYLGSGGIGYIAFNASGGNNHLWFYNTYTNVGSDTALGMMPGTSPAMTADGASLSDLYDEILFQSNTGLLYAFNNQDNTHMNFDLGMAGGSSPSVAPNF